MSQNPSPSSPVKKIALALAAVILAGGAAYVFTQGNANPEAKRAAEIKKELQVPANDLEDMVLGQAEAPVTIYEYASLSCSHCAEFHNKVLPELKTKYIDTGKVRLVMREFPLEERATGAAMVARCAPKEKYFAIVSAYFETQRAWATGNDLQKDLFKVAQQAGFTEAGYMECLGNPQLYGKIMSVRTHAADKLGVNSTPTFFINGVKVPGVLTVKELEQHLK